MVLTGGVFRYKPTVLVANHDESFAMDIAIALNRMGFDVIPVESGDDAVEVAVSFSPDIVMLDVDLPGTDGITALKKIRADNDMSEMQVVLMAYEKSDDILLACERFRCCGIVTKPLNVVRFHEALQDCIKYPGGKKRRHLRSLYGRTVHLQYNGAKTDYEGISLSEGGMYLRGLKRYDAGLEVEVRFPVHDRTSMHLKGNVIYTKRAFGAIFDMGPGIAVEFGKMSDIDSALLRDHICRSITKGLSGVHA
ncbi:MAG: response regulator [Nitrospirota bacterium]|nr:MAG: response regulator [Nitrospirota bacterium]